MAIAHPLRVSLDTIRRRPELVGFGFWLAVFAVVELVFRGFGGSVFGLLSFFVTPLLVGGFLAVADAARRDSTDRTFWSAGRRHYWSILGGELLGGALILAGTVASLVLVVLLTGLDFARLLADGLSTLGPVEAVGVAVVAVVYVGGGTLFAFTRTAIVLEGRTAVEGVRRSAGFVADAPLSVVGFELTRVLVNVGTVGTVGWLVLDRPTSITELLFSLSRLPLQGDWFFADFGALLVAQTAYSTVAIVYNVCFFAGTAELDGDGSAPETPSPSRRPSAE